MGTNNTSNGKQTYITVLKIVAPMLIVAFILVANIIAKVTSKEAGAALLVGDKYAPMFVKDTADAKKSIICAMYMFKLDAYFKDNLGEPVALIGAALIDAAKRGVLAAVVFERGKPDEITTKYNEETAEYLKKNGVKVFFDSPEQRLHTKMCVIDDEVTYIGSHNYTYSAMTRNSEVSVRIVSKDLAKEALAYFNSLIEKSETEPEK